MRIKGIKIDEDVARILNEQDKDDTFNIGDKVWRRNPETQDRMIGEVVDKSHKDGQEYITVKFYWWSSHDGTYPADFFQKLDKSESIKEAGKCTWHAWQEGKTYACEDDCTYGHIDDFIGMEEDIEKFVKAGWVNADGEIVIPAGAVFQVRKLHTPSGIVLYYPDIDMELDTVLDEDDDTLYEIINESKNEDYEDIQRTINEEDTNEFPKGSFAEWFGEDLTGQTYEGDIDCSNEELTSLYGAPEYVEGHFYCYNNKLTSLKGAPEYVGGWFDCSDNNLTSLEGAPEHVEGRFDCSSNDLTSLEGAPKEVNGNFNCSHNQLTTLEGAPEKVTNDFYCYNNKLTSLKGAPEYIGGGLICINNPDLESLEGVGEVEDSIYSDIEE